MTVVIDTDTNVEKPEQGPSSDRRATTARWDDRISRRWTVILRNKRRHGDVDDSSTEDLRKRKSFVVKMIQSHYTLVEVTKTEQQLARESWLFPSLSVRFNRWFCMPAAFLIQFCCGSLFTWIVFDKPIDQFIYGSVGVSSHFAFYCAVAVIGLSAITMGPWLERRGPKMANLFGATLFLFGNLIVAVALFIKQTWLVYIGYCISAGYGIGLCFISPVSALQKWFPDRRGLASGIAVSGFAAGSLASSSLQTILIHAMDLPLTFVFLGVAYFMCIFFAGLVIRAPPPGYTPPNYKPEIYIESVPTSTIDIELAGLPTLPPPPKKTYTLLEALASSEFRWMYIMFFANLNFNLTTGPALISMIMDLFGKTEQEATTVFVIKGVFDLFGRILFPLCSDYIGRKNTYFFMLTVQMLIILGLYFIVSYNIYWLFVVSVWTVSICYGGGFGTLSVILVEKFGAVNVGPCFGVIITAWSLSGISGGVLVHIVYEYVTKSSENDPYQYFVMIWVLLLVVVVGWVSLLFVKPTEIDNEFYQKLKKLFGNS